MKSAVWALLVLSTPGLAQADPCTDELKAARANRRVVRIVEAPTAVRPHTAEYDLGTEAVLRAGESVYFVLPREFRTNALDFAVIKHRQDPALTRGGDARDHAIWDDFPAYLSLQALSSDMAGWRYWGGPASSVLGAKFAEVRTSPEEEGLYEWRRYGDYPVATPGRGVSRSGLHSCLVRVVASGADPVSVRGVVLKSAPARPRSFVERIYTPGTEFGDFDSAEGRSYGGGEAKRGTYPSALRLVPVAGAPIVPAGEDWTAKGASLRIPLHAGEVFTSIEIALGDSPGWDLEKDIYLRGGSRITIQHFRKDGASETLVARENIGPQGVVKGYGSSRRASEAGEYLEIRVTDVTFVMGVRVGFDLSAE